MTSDDATRMWELEQIGFTPEEIAEATECPTLGPAYFSARSFVGRMMEGFEPEHFKPLVEDIGKRVQDRIWEDVQASLLSDLEYNVQGEIWRTVDNIIVALLTGEKWALQRYVVDDRRIGDAPKVREAIVTHCRDQIAEQRIADLEKEVADLQERIKWMR